MNNIVFELAREPKEKDVIIFKNGKWTVTNKDLLFKEFQDKTNQRLNQQENEIKKLQKNLVDLAKIVKEK